MQACNNLRFYHIPVNNFSCKARFVRNIHIRQTLIGQSVVVVSVRLSRVNSVVIFKYRLVNNQSLCEGHIEAESVNSLCPAYRCQNHIFAL